MTLTLFDTIRRIVQEELSRVRTAELGVVTEQHPHAAASDRDNYACTVQLRDTGIVLKKVPVATQRIGMVSIPAVGDLVMVQFVGGDLNAPIITGRLYNDEDRPPASSDGQAILHLPPGAGDDDAVHVELSSGDRREILLTLGSGLKVHLRDEDPVVELSVDDGKASLKIERDGAMTVESQGDLTLKGGDVSLSGNTVTIEAQGQLKLKGTTIDLN